MMLNAENHATVLNDLLNLVEDKDSKGLFFVILRFLKT